MAELGEISGHLACLKGKLVPSHRRDCWELAKEVMTIYPLSFSISEDTGLTEQDLLSGPEECIKHT